MNTEILNRLLSFAPTDVNAELPPKSFFFMEGDFIEFIEGQSLTIRYPNKEQYSNPFGFMQGGIITAAIDNTVSPFSYVIAPMSITKEIVTKYKRPIRSEDNFIDVTATLLNKTDNEITIQGEVKNEKGKIAAIGIAHSIFIKHEK